MKFAYTIQELVEMGGGCRTKIYEALNNGSLKGKKRGASTVILPADAEAYLGGLPDYEPRPAHNDSPDPGAVA